MARKKKAEESQDTAMTAEELFKVRAYMAEADLAQLKVQFAALQKRELLKQIDPNNKLAGFDSIMADAASVAATKRIAYKETLAKVAERLGMDPGKIAWDDETGLVRLLDQDE